MSTSLVELRAQTKIERLYTGSNQPCTATFPLYIN